MTAGAEVSRAAVVGTDGVVAEAVVAALHRAGVAVGPADDHPVDLVVHVADHRGTDRPLAELDEQAWDDAAEAPARALLATIQEVHGPLRGSGGRLVIVLPAAALEGAAGLVAETVGWETMRVLAKSAARRWADDGIGVHVVAVHLDRSDDPDRAYGEAEPDDASVHAAADAVALLSAGHASWLTGQTLIVDGGRLMLP